MRLKRIGAILASAVMSVSVSMPAFATESTASDVQVNGRLCDTKAEIIDDIAYVNANEVADILGVSCTISQNGAFVDGKTVKMEEGGLVSLREVAEAVGCMIGWDSNERTVVIVDLDKMAEEKGVTFDILRKYMEYSLSMGDTYSTKAEIKGGVEVNDGENSLAVPFSGTVEGVSGKTGQESSLKLAIDLSQMKAEAAKDMTPEEKEIFEGIIKSLENSNSKVIYDAEKNIAYMNSTLFSFFGSDENTYIKMDMNSMLEGVGGMDMNSMLNLIKSGDIENYILETLKGLPVDSVSSYDEISKAYDLIASMMGDKAFTLENGKYSSTFSVKEEGVELTYVMTFGTEGDKINSCLITMKMGADEVSMDMSAATDKDFNSTMSFTMSVSEIMKMYMDMKSTFTPSKAEPNLTIPDNARVVDFEELMGVEMLAEIEASETAPDSPEPAPKVEDTSKAELENSEQTEAA
ncbi:hypothetical protein IMSAG049_01107 [Clostridiales bacterium]|nr:hypothetical protein IMSAG049_01107 [Clostridiales bacterium]